MNSNVRRRNAPRSARRAALASATVAALLLTAACTGAQSTGDDEAGEPAFDVEAISSPDEIDLSGRTVQIVDVGVLGPLDMGGVRLLEMLEDWGATVERTELTSVSATQAILAGHSGIAAEGPDAIIQAVSQGAEFSAIGAANSAPKYVLVTRRDIESVEDLDGGAIAISGPGGFDTLLNTYMLQEAGLQPDQDVRFVPIGDTQARAAALMAGNVDATTFFMENWFNVSQQSDDFRLLMNLADVFPNVVSDVYFARPDYWEENPDIALAVACANVTTNREFFEDEDRYVEYALEHTEGYDEESIRATYEFAREVEMNPPEASDIMSLDGIQALMDAMVETGAISGAIDPAAAFDESFLERADEIGC